MKTNNAAELMPGDVVQIAPECGNPMFACCFLVISEIRGWGIQGYVQSLGENGQPGGQAYIRLKWDEFEYVGEATWTTGIESEAVHES